MGTNEVLLFLTAILSAAFVYIGWKINRERLYGVIVVFLILISIVGVKTVEFFGFETNTGNIFYASVFLATYFLVERLHSSRAVRRLLRLRCSTKHLRRLFVSRSRASLHTW